MAMNKIGRPEFTQPKVLEQFQRNSAASAKESANGQTGVPKIGTGATGSTEKVQISATARKLEHLRHAVAAGRTALEAVPDVRQERLDQVRARLQAGFYDSDRVRQDVAERLSGVMKKLDSLLD